ncbi:hypothetical protein ABTE85_21790, partial [Acinetobacter baumannii]
RATAKTDALRRGWIVNFSKTIHPAATGLSGLPSSLQCGLGDCRCACKKKQKRNARHPSSTPHFSGITMTTVTVNTRADYAAFLLR